MKYVTLVSALLLTALSQAPAADELPAKLEFAAKTDKWYADQKAAEATYTGVLQKRAVMAKAPKLGRVNNYVLARNVGGQISQLEVFTSNLKTVDLAKYEGKTVTLVGKYAVTPDPVTKNFLHQELWTRELTYKAAGGTDKKPPDKDKPMGVPQRVFARYHWQSEPDGDGAPLQAVVMDAEQLVKTTGNPEKAKDEAVQKKTVDSMAQAMKVKDIDWNKQMMIVVGGGKQSTDGFVVDVTGVEKRGDMLVVLWKLQKVKAGTPVTEGAKHPTMAILVGKFDGAVTFDPPAEKKDSK